jgi:hypothetical protein
MNLEKQDVSGSPDKFAEEFKRVCQTGIMTPEEIKRKRAELKFAEEKNRLLAAECYMAGLKEATRRTLKGEIADEW